jgi:3-methyladenine DNA glycosylase AlkD
MMVKMIINNMGKSDFPKIKEELGYCADKERAKILLRFFKTGKGEYGEGDVFLGIKAPDLKKIIQKYYKEASLKNIQTLLLDKIHEYRSVALEILKKQYKKSDEKRKKEIVRFYLKNTKNINNWDLVDCSAPHILGNWLLAHQEERKILYKLACSKNLWERRISILSTLAFIRQKEFKDTLKISEVLIYDKHDLIHKAVGWMLREVGKRDQKTEEEFLKKYSKIMPRTMLRYAIERFPEKKRKLYMAK